MSGVSSKINSVSSILKTPGVRSQFIRKSNNVCFELPKDLKNIISGFINGSCTKDYEHLICALHHPNIRDSDLIKFMTSVRQCITLFHPNHKAFIEALLQIKWTNRSLEVISAYKIFLEELAYLQICYTQNVINYLVEQFKPDENDNIIWKGGNRSEESNQRLNHIHDVLRQILILLPMSSKLLLESLREKFPYITHTTHTHEVFVYALLQIIEYAPQLQFDILCLIIHRLIVLDTNTPCLVTDNENNTPEKNNITETDNIHPIAHKLDVCMELVLKYIHDSCFVEEAVQIESLKTLYFNMLYIFETVILPTFESQYVQYIMFYICSFKKSILKDFIHWLWHKILDCKVPYVIKQSSVAYIASFLTTATFVSTRLMETKLLDISRWIHEYINMRDHINDLGAEYKKHALFYSVCQALILIITKRHNDYSDSKKYMSCLQKLDLTGIISCKLNPLKTCHPEIVHNFTKIVQMHQLVDICMIIKNNTRSQLPIFYDNKVAATTIDNFLPFNSYTLKRSRHRFNLLCRNTDLDDNAIVTPYL